MLLSVIIPVYNGEDYIARCLDSILNQDLVDYEILVIDDGSTDGTASIVENYALSHPRIIKLLRQTNSGQGIARNKGIMEAQGEYLSFVDADDYIEDNSYPFLLSQMKENSLDLLCCNYKKVDTDGNELCKKKIELITKYPLEGIVITDASDFLYNYFGFLCYTWLFIYRRDFVISTGLLFKPKIYMEDTEWLSKLMCSADKIGITSFVFYNYVQTLSSSMRNRNLDAEIKRIDDSLYVISLLSEYERGVQDIEKKIWLSEMRSCLEIILFHMSVNPKYKLYGDYIYDFLMKVDTPLLIRKARMYKFTALCLQRSWNISRLIFSVLFRVKDIFCFNYSSI